MKNALQIADELIALGLAPVPLRSPDDPSEQDRPPEKRGKRPLRGDFGWQKEPAPKSLDDLPELLPEHNVGVRTGRVIGAPIEVIVVDVDGENGYHFARTKLPPTPVVTLTGTNAAGFQKQHWYYRRPDVPVVNGRVRVPWQDPFHDNREVILSVDVKADGGQAVAPGSVHGTGAVYEAKEPWTKELLAQMPIFDPAWFPKPAPVVTTEKREEVPDVSEAEKRRRFGAYLRACPPSVPQMPPQGAGVHVLGIARFGVWDLAMDPDEAAEVMHRSSWNDRCTDERGSRYPWSLDELRHKCREAAKPTASGEAMRRPRGGALRKVEGEVDRAVIRLGPDTHRVADETVAALARWPEGPFVHASHLAAIAPESEESVTWLDKHSLAYWMGHAARYVSLELRVSKGDDGEKEQELVEVEKAAPLAVAQTILSNGESKWHGVRKLRRVSRLPPVTLDGRVTSRPGYDAASQVYYLGGEVDVPDRPSRDQALEAVDRIMKLVRVVRFKADVDRSKWLALLLTLACRTAYSTCPLFLVRAPEQNSGKTMCVHVAHGLLFGKKAEDSVVKDPESPDWGKAVHGWSLKPLVLWDNWPDGRRFSNPELAKILTNPRTSDREMFKHSFMKSDFSGTVFVVTGNNITLDADHTVRSSVINLLKIKDFDPDFNPTSDNPFVDRWRQGQRDVYTVVRAWAAAGCPRFDVKAHPKFPDWSSVVQQQLLWLGFPDPVTDNAELDGDRAAAEAVVTQIARLFGRDSWRVSDLFRKYIEGNDLASEAVGAVQSLTRRQRRFDSAISLGQALGVILDRTVDADGSQLRVEQAPKVGGVTRYRIAGWPEKALGGVVEARSSKGEGRSTGSRSAKP